MTPTYRAPAEQHRRARSEWARVPGLRELTATVLITGSAAGSHALAGGRMPPVGFVLSLGGVVFLCCLARTWRSVPVSALVAATVAAQLVLHTLLETAPLPAPADMAGMPGMPAMDVTVDHPPMVSAAMLWAHVVAALVTAIVLLAQDSLVALIISWWASPCLPLVKDSRFGVGVPARAPFGARGRFLLISPRRGPPLPAVTTS